MKWRVSIRAAARPDLQQAHDWYEEHCVGLGTEFLAAIAEVLMRLEANPEAYAVYYREFRRVLTHRFYYKLFFRTEGDAVIVFRVLHGAQDHQRRLSGGAETSGRQAEDCLHTSCVLCILLPRPPAMQILAEADDFEIIAGLGFPRMPNPVHPQFVGGVEGSDGYGVRRQSAAATALSRTPHQPARRRRASLAAAVQRSPTTSGCTGPNLAFHNFFAFVQ